MPLAPSSFVCVNASIDIDSAEHSSRLKPLANCHLDKPPSPKAAKVEWRFLDDNVQTALREEPVINAAVVKRRTECKGAVSGDVTLTCVKADDKLTQVLVDYLRKGGKVPVPSKLPQ